MLPATARLSRTLASPARRVPQLRGYTLFRPSQSRTLARPHQAALAFAPSLSVLSRPSSSAAALAQSESPAPPPFRYSSASSVSSPPSFAHTTMAVPPLDFPPPPPIPTASGKVDLLLPPTEDRPHRYVVLPNGLEVILVSDPKADKAAASMSVGVGHLSDPVDLAGCAHFCEHLMFMGTKSHPSENEYSSYLSAHNGNSNAWTAMCDTNYFFDVAPDALDGALDRFSGFFVEPLFSADCTEREIKAVNSEHKKNIQHDMWRAFQLEKSLSKPGHVYGKFGTGNLDTLWNEPRADGRDPRQQLIEWWEKEYCARRMKLAVAGREDLDTLERMVRERFDRVPVRTEGCPSTGPNGVRVTFDDHPFGPEQRGHVTLVKSVRDQRGLEIAVPTPDVSHLAGLKPFSFIAHFVGHEGRGSLLSYLKRKGWVNELSAGNSHEANGFGFFKVNCQLTPDGLEHWKDVSLAVFKYFELLRSNPPGEAAFKEIAQLAEISFKYADRSRTRDYVTHLSGWMQSPVERREIVSSKYLLGEYDAELIRKCIELLDPRNCAIGMSSQELPKDVTGTYDKKEAIYGTEYRQDKIPEELMREATSGAPIPELALPEPNLFIPENFAVEKFEVDTPSHRPELLRDTEVSRLWYKRDDRFWLPKTNVHIELSSPLVDVTPRNAVLARLLCDAFSDATNEYNYDAELAELSFHLFYSGESVCIMVNGFTDKLSLLLETMLNKLMTFEIDEERFDKLVYAAKTQWQNFKLHEPYHVSHYWSSYVTMNRVWTPEEKLEEIKHITPADVQAFGRELLKRMHIETLVHGNTTPEGAKSLQDMVEKVLHPRALSPVEKISRRSLLLPEASQNVWELPVGNPAEVNSCVVYWVYMGEFSDPVARAKIALLGQIATEPAFNMLRTKEQLGYVAMASATSTGFRVLVQSERDPVYVESRIEEFLEHLRSIIADMSEEEFARHRASLIAKREEQPKNLGEESRRYWQRISDRYYEFNKRQNDIAHLKTTSKEDVLDIFSKAVHPESAERRKLSVHLRSQAKAEAKLDPAAAQALLAAFAKHGIAIEPPAPTKPVEEIVAVAAKGVEEASVDEEVKKELREMVAKLSVPAETNGDVVQLRDGNVLIKDIHAFKAGLTPSKAALPLEPLVVSRL